MKWRWLLASMLVVAACGGSESVPDTNCAESPDSAEQVRFQGMLFDGVVVSWDGTTATVAVNEIWRGVDIPADVEVVPEPGRAYTEGVRYLFFPTNSRPPFIDTPCSATVRWTEEIAALRPEAARRPVNATATDPDLPWEWLFGVLGAVGAVMVVAGLRRRRPGATATWNPDHRIAFERRSDDTDEG